MDKININEYLNNYELLELVYTPYEEKIHLVDMILDSCIIPTSDNLIRLDSVLLDRISTEIFITTITNLDMEQKSENGLSAYDELCRTGTLENLINLCGNEYDIFNFILKTRINDFEKANNSIYTIIDYVFNQLTINDMTKAKDIFDYALSNDEFKNKLFNMKE